MKWDLHAYHFIFAHGRTFYPTQILVCAVDALASANCQVLAWGRMRSVSQKKSKSATISLCNAMLSDEESSFILLNYITSRIAIIRWSITTPLHTDNFLFHRMNPLFVCFGPVLLASMRAVVPFGYALAPVGSGNSPFPVQRWAKCLPHPSTEKWQFLRLPCVLETMPMIQIYLSSSPRKVNDEPASATLLIRL